MSAAGLPSSSLAPPDDGSCCRPFPIEGRDGASLAEKFGANEGNRFQMTRPQSLWGIHVDEMPNFYMMIGPQSLNPVTNVTLLCEEQAKYIADLVSRMAACFVGHGFDIRHLRMYLVAAQREAGLLEQLVGPVAGANGEGSGRPLAEARQLVDEVTDAGSALHELLLRRELGLAGR